MASLRPSGRSGVTEVEAKEVAVLVEVQTGDSQYNKDVNMAITQLLAHCSRLRKQWSLLAHSDISNRIINPN